jgi:mycothiol S-conjugate amidase
LAEVRREELMRSAAIIGYDTVELLGYHDSGMPDTEVNAREDYFWNADFDEAIGRLVAIIRRDRPQVIVTYGDDQRHYAHPDHLRVHDISVPAFERAADPYWYPEAGEPWQPLKLYYTVWSRRRMLGLHEKFLELGLESPFGEDWMERMRNLEHDDRVTTLVPIAEHYDVREKALLAHATQVDPESPFWFGLPTEVARDVHPWDDYILARSLVDSEPPEDDLFAGIPGR